MKDISELYSEGTWGGFVNYECIYCPHATLDEGEAREHALKHWIKLQVAPVALPLPAAPGPLRSKPVEDQDEEGQAHDQQEAEATGAAPLKTSPTALEALARVPMTGELEA